MNFMIAVDHTFEVAQGSFSDSAEIDMYEHENRYQKAYENVKKIGQMESAYT
jgi:hypothetical protein